MAEASIDTSDILAYRGLGPYGYGYGYGGYGGCGPRSTGTSGCYPDVVTENIKASRQLNENLQDNTQDNIRGVGDQIRDAQVRREFISISEEITRSNQQTTRDIACLDSKMCDRINNVSQELLKCCCDNKTLILETKAELVALNKDTVIANLERALAEARHCHHGHHGGRGD